MRRDLKALLLEKVNPVQVYEDILGGYESGQNVLCPFHSDSNPSASVREKDGAFYCHSCGKKFSSFVGFFEAYYKIPYQTAMHRLHHRYIAPVVPLRRVYGWHKELWKRKKVIEYIEDKRGISETTIKFFKLGWNGERITIPIFNEYGTCLNVRLYHPRRTPKIISFRKGYGSARLFPIEKWREDEQETILVEGEWDAILAWQMGYNVLTSTGGANSWTPQFSKLLKGKDVVIFYDADKAGREGAKRVGKSISGVGKTVSIVSEKPRGVRETSKDLSDYVVKDGINTQSISTHLRHSEHVGGVNGSKRVESETEETIEVKIHDASKSSIFYRPIRTTAHVAGKRLTPYLPPKKVRIKCRMDRGKLCQTCHMLPHKGVRSFDFKATDSRVLGLIDSSDFSIKRVARDIARIPPGCTTTVETLSTFNIEEITVIPPIDEAGGHYTARLAYYIGHGLPSNRSYSFEGYTIPHPKDQSATHIFTEAIPAQSSLETYIAKPGILERLRRFNPGSGRIITRLKDIEEYLSSSVTRIINRRSMHLAIDLVFHSPIRFVFNGELVKKGWLEVAVIGDTRCGKGYVATELVRFYGLGEIATAENCSFAGLVGGIMKSGNNMSITWGLIPRNTGRLVIIDETSGLSTSDIARMTRVRSEGIAEIYKIQSEATQARTRIVWLSNARTGRPVNTYAYGVETVPELFGKSEDVSKLDYALVVSSGEVKAEVINAYRHPSKDEEEVPYEREDFRNLIMWIWTRTEDQIFFTPEATELILTSAMHLGRKYHPSIPLIQIEDVRIKLAKLSAAIAGRIFSADKSGTSLLITKECVEVALSFLSSIYDRQPTSYLNYSENQYAATTIPNEAAVTRLLYEAGKYRASLVQGLLDTKTLGITDVADFMNCDKFVAKELIGELVRARCLQKEYSFYVKRPAFINLLRGMV